MRYNYFVLFLWGIATISNRVEPQKVPKMEQSEEIAYQKLLANENATRKLIADAVKKMMAQFSSSESPLSLEISDGCLASAFQFITDLEKLKMWSIEMVGVLSFSEGGAFRGNVHGLGSYKQCLEVVIPPNGKGKSAKGNYCVIGTHAPLPPKPPGTIKIYQNVFPNPNHTFETELFQTMKRFAFIAFDLWARVGVCVPSTCSKTDLNEILKFVQNKTDLYMAVEYCTTRDFNQMDGTQFYVLAAFLAIIALNAIGTVVDEVHGIIFRDNNVLVNEPWFRFARMFSVRRNFAKLIRTRTVSKVRSLDSMNGIKFFSATWVAIGHSYSLHNPFFIREATRLLDIIDSFPMQAVTSAFLCLSSFVFITSTLISYSCVKYYDQTKSFGAFSMLLKRLWRLFPLLLMTVGAIILLPLVCDGPTAQYNHIGGNVCRRDWWKVVLFLSNFFDFRNSCASHTWYVAMDFQLTFLAILYFIILFRNVTLANTLLVILTLGSIGSSAILTYIFQYPPTIIFTVIDIDRMFHYMNYFYTMPYTYLGVYAVGLFTGTYLARNSDLQISNRMAVLGWLVASASGMAIVYSTLPWNQSVEYSMAEAVVYAGLHKTSWAICLAWVVVTCYCGKAGWINDFLSWPGFQPLSRLAYEFYLLHIIFFFYISANMQGMYDFGHYTLVNRLLAITSISFILAVFVNVTLTTPLNFIYLAIFGPKNDKNTKLPLEKNPEPIKNDM